MSLAPSIPPNFPINRFLSSKGLGRPGILLIGFGLLSTLILSIGRWQVKGEKEAGEESGVRRGIRRLERNKEILDQSKGRKLIRRQERTVEVGVE